MITQEQAFGNLGIKSQTGNAGNIGVARSYRVTDKICHFIRMFANPPVERLHSTSQFAFQSGRAGKIGRVLA